MKPQPNGRQAEEIWIYSASLWEGPEVGKEERKWERKARDNAPGFTLVSNSLP